MATTGQMIGAGIADLVCTFTLIYFAYLGSRIFTPIINWVFAVQYVSEPVINPGLVDWAYPMYYGLLIAIWIVIQIALFFVVINREIYSYPGMG